MAYLTPLLRRAFEKWVSGKEPGRSIPAELHVLITVGKAPAGVSARAFGAAGSFCREIIEAMGIS